MFNICSLFDILNEFKDGGLIDQNNFAHTINQNILNCHIN